MEALHRMVSIGSDTDIIVIKCVENQNKEEQDDKFDKEKEQQEIDEHIDDCMRRIIESLTYDD